MLFEILAILIAVFVFWFIVFLTVQILSTADGRGQEPLVRLLTRRFTAKLRTGCDQAEVKVVEARKQMATALSEAEDAEAKLQLERVARGQSPELAVAMIRHEIRVEELRTELQQRRTLREQIASPKALPAGAVLPAPLEVAVSSSEVERMALRIAQQLASASDADAQRQLAILAQDLRSRLPELVAEEVIRRALSFRDMAA